MILGRCWRIFVVTGRHFVLRLTERKIGRNPESVVVQRHCNNVALRKCWQSSKEVDDGALLLV